MKRLSWAVMGLFLVGSTAVGCAHMPRRPGTRDGPPCIDGTRGLDNFNRVGEANWTAVDGAIQADAGRQGSGYLVTKNSYKDFMLRVEFWASDDANSGVFLRCPDPGRSPTRTATRPTSSTSGRTRPTAPARSSRSPRCRPMPKAGGKWNTYEITAKGNRLTLVLNGVKTVDVEDFKFASGPIALQWAPARQVPQGRDQAAVARDPHRPRPHPHPLPSGERARVRGRAVPGCEGQSSRITRAIAAMFPSG